MEYNIKVKDYKDFALLWLELDIFLKRYQYISNRTDDSIQLSFDHKTKLCFSKILKCQEKLGHNLFSINGGQQTAKPHDELTELISSSNLLLLYNPIEDWEDELIKLGSDQLIRKKTYSTQQLLYKAKKRFSKERLINHYICLLFEFRALRARQACLVDSPLLHFELKKNFKYLSNQLMSLDGVFERIIKGWETPKIEDLLEELSFNSTGLNELLLFKSKEEREVILTTLFT